MLDRDEDREALKLEATEYELSAWEGRKICDREELGGGYCGSASLEVHVNQMRDPGSWVHSSKERWVAAAAIERAKGGAL